MSISTSVFNHEQHIVFADIIGKHMHTVITNPVVEIVRTGGIEQRMGTERAFERWVTAMRLLNDPVLARVDIADLEPNEAAAIEQATRPYPVAKIAAEELRSNKKLRKITRGMSGLRENTGRQIDDLLKNGVVDSRNWISVLLSEGVPYEQILDHPAFPTATTLITPAHMLLLGSFTKPRRPASVTGSGQNQPTNEYSPDNAPKTRQAAIEIVRSTTQIERALAYGKSGDDPQVRPLEARGYCPAARMKDASGQTWLRALVSRVLDLQLKTSA